jgi:hypothetical protein
MSLKRLAMLLPLLLALLNVTACKRAAPPADEAAQPAATPLAEATPEAPPSPTPEVVAAAPNQFESVFVGQLDSDLNVQMELARQGNKLSGSYVYIRPGADNEAEKTLMLAGKIEQDGKVTLSETADTGAGVEQRTGEFKGVIDSVSSKGAPQLRFLGVWSNLKTKKTAPFALQERRFDFGDYKLIKKPVREKNRKLRLEIDASLPQLSAGDPVQAGKFNQAVAAFLNKQLASFKADVAEVRKGEQEAAQENAKTAAAEQNTEAIPSAPLAKGSPADERPPFSFDGGYEIHFASPDLISLMFGYSTYSGGAHPNHFTAGFTYDLKRGAQVTLPELFAPKSNYLKVISSYSIKELKKLETADGAETGAAPKLQNFKSWSLTPQGLRIVFDPYQVGPYVAGAHKVLVPYDLLKSVAKPDGWLVAFLK